MEDERGEKRVIYDVSAAERVYHASTLQSVDQLKKGKQAGAAGVESAESSEETSGLEPQTATLEPLPTAGMQAEAVGSELPESSHFQRAKDILFRKELSSESSRAADMEFRPNAWKPETESPDAVDIVRGSSDSNAPGSEATEQSAAALDSAEQASSDATASVQENSSAATADQAKPATTATASATPDADPVDQTAHELSNFDSVEEPPMKKHSVSGWWIAFIIVILAAVALAIGLYTVQEKTGHRPFDRNRPSTTERAAVTKDDDSAGDSDSDAPDSDGLDAENNDSDLEDADVEGTTDEVESEDEAIGGLLGENPDTSNGDSKAHTSGSPSGTRQTTSRSNWNTEDVVNEFWNGLSRWLS